MGGIRADILLATQAHTFVRPWNWTAESNRVSNTNKLTRLRNCTNGGNVMFRPGVGTIISVWSLHHICSLLRLWVRPFGAEMKTFALKASIESCGVVFTVALIRGSALLQSSRADLLVRRVSEMRRCPKRLVTNGRKKNHLKYFSATSEASTTGSTLLGGDFPSAVEGTNAILPKDIPSFCTRWRLSLAVFQNQVVVKPRLLLAHAASFFFNENPKSLLMKL